MVLYRSDNQSVINV